MPHTDLSLTTSGRTQVVDLTDDVERAVHDSGVANGLVCVSVAHCTCAVYVNESESGLIADTVAFLQALAQGARWQHDRIDDNAAAHLVASVVGNSVCLPLVDGRVALGTWQRVMLVELDGPRQRRVTVTVVAG